MDVRLARARWELGKLHVEDLPAFSADALEAGLDGPTVRRVAGLVKPNFWDVFPLLDIFWNELGAPELTKEEAISDILKETARQIVETPVRAREIADTLSPIYYEHFNRDIWAFLDPMDYGDMIPLEEQRSQILEVAQAYLAGEPLWKQRPELSVTEPAHAKTEFKIGGFAKKIKSFFTKN